MAFYFNLIIATLYLYHFYIQARQKCKASQQVTFQNYINMDSIKTIQDIILNLHDKGFIYDHHVFFDLQMSSVTICKSHDQQISNKYGASLCYRVLFFPEVILSNYQRIRHIKPLDFSEAVLTQKIFHHSENNGGKITTNDSVLYIVIKLGQIVMYQISFY